MSEKPPYVRAAEALGWTECRLESFSASEDDIGERVAGLPTWWGVSPDGRLAPVPRMNDKPLHVLVAEALGWRSRGPSVMNDRDCGGTEFWVAPGHSIDGARSYCNVCAPESSPPRYDTDWSATGPLIERYDITLLYIVNTDQPSWEAMERACMGHDGELFNGAEYETPPREPSTGPTPLVAVCNLILALHSAGKLAATLPARASRSTPR